MGNQGSVFKKPVVGWVVAAAILVLAVISYVINTSPKPDELMAQGLTIRCSETGETWQVMRGVVQKELMGRSYPVDPNEGLVNPKTGKRTGFPVDDWKKLVSSVNAQRAPDAPVAPAGK